MMPFEGQTEILVEDAKDEIRKRLSVAKVEFFSPEIRRVSWNQKPEKFFFSEDIPRASQPSGPNVEMDDKEIPLEDNFLR